MKTLPDRPFNPRQDKTDRERLLPYGARNHPAKMNIALALDLVERYTRPGMHILDPCYGVGTTGVALLKGRHVTGIELEPHHHRDALANSKHLERIAHDFGKEGGAVVILGDAREQIPWLVNHAKEAVITSGAFGEMNAPHRGGDITQRPTKDGKDFEGNKEQFVYGGHDQPQTEGTLFSVSVTSPAYSNQEVATTDNTQTPGGIGKAYRERGVRAEDILLGRDYQKIVDAHILSPAYGTQMPDQGDPQVGVDRVKRKVESGELRTDNPGGVGRRTAWGGGQVRSYAYGYGADVGPRSVDAPGGPDTILFSPGYGANRIEQHESTNDVERRQERLKAAGVTTTSPKPNDPYWQAEGYNVDSVTTSPAYGEVASRDRHLEPFAAKDPEKAAKYGQDSVSRNVSGYGKNEAQVGNMKLPAYSDAMLDIYRRCLDVTRPGGVLVTVTGNYISEGKIIDLAALTIDLCVAAGWTPVERWRAIKRNKNGSPAVSFWRTIQAKQGMPLIDWEDVIVCCKGEQPGWEFSPLSGGWPG